LPFFLPAGKNFTKWTQHFLPVGKPGLRISENERLACAARDRGVGGAKLWSACSLLPLSLAEARFRPGYLGRPCQAPFPGGKPVEQTRRQQAGASKSGSKLHALQSFAPSARRDACNLCVAHPPSRNWLTSWYSQVKIAGVYLPVRTGTQQRRAATHEGFIPKTSHWLFRPHAIPR